MAEETLKTYEYFMFFIYKMKKKEGRFYFGLLIFYFLSLLFLCPFLIRFLLEVSLTLLFAWYAWHWWNKKVRF